MQKKNLIVFEGIDNSGKTTISKKFVEYLREKDRYKEWVWTKEPDFTTEEADRLNDPEVNMDEYEREELFLASRFRRQPTYQNNHCVVDRYLWTGLAYAELFSPGAYPFARVIYSKDIFIKPDLYVFVDTPVEICDQRDPTVGKERLEKIRQAYINNIDLIDSPIITIESTGDLDQVLAELIKKYEEVIYK
jgi:dTMP kinase